MMPTLLATMMDTLMKNGPITSWNIWGDDDQTQLIIRFSANNMADITNVKYKKVNPGQQTRDRRRQEQYMSAIPNALEPLDDVDKQLPNVETNTNSMLSQGTSHISSSTVSASNSNTVSTEMNDTMPPQQHEAANQLQATYCQAYNYCSVSDLWQGFGST